MNKKRLEEITSSVGILLSGDRHVLLRRKHYEWLIEQVERVQELEEAIADYAYEIGKRKRALNKINEQNKRYREALEEIMRTETVTTALADGQVAYTISGHIARKALEGEGNA